MPYSVGEFLVYDTFANLPANAAAGASSGTPSFALDTMQWCLFNGSAWVPVLSAPRIASVGSAATPSINTQTTDMFEITALAVAMTSVTVTAGVDGQRL